MEAKVSSQHWIREEAEEGNQVYQHAGGGGHMVVPEAELHLQPQSHLALHGLDGGRRQVPPRHRHHLPPGRSRRRHLGPHHLLPPPLMTLVRGGEDALGDHERHQGWCGRGKEGVTSYKQLNEMHYVHATIYKSMHLFSPVQFNSKFCIEDYVQFDSKFCVDNRKRERD
ncbi:Cytochrome P450 [Canna indica]|uniref:Cytochrome P450 n=1 Tax=Canna indica TaxID=4628 RepID=A0AAQ3KMM2_9LILI|nr:Cytochrome P450 [Canna indica]